MATFNHTSRRDVIFMGKEMPLQVMTFSWTSAMLESLLFKIITEELMGIRVEIRNPTFGSTIDGIRALFCEDPTNGIDPKCCRSNGATFGHVVVEVWSPSVSGLLELVDRDCPEMKPISYGTLGYYGLEPTYVSSVAAGLARQAYVPLEYYISYSDPKVNFREFFDDPWSVPTSDLMPCSSTLMQTDASHGGSYHQFYGASDPEGTVAENSSDGSLIYKMNCSGLGGGYWWLSPTCRRNTSMCLPYITGGNGWSIKEMIHRAVAWDMPVAIAVAGSWSLYQVLPIRHRVMFYWWFPDSIFTAYSPAPMVWPRHNAREWDQGNQRTAEDVTAVKLQKWAHFGIRNKSNVGFKSPLALLERLSLTPQMMQEMLETYTAMGGTSSVIEAVACDWLNSNAAFWYNGTERWIAKMSFCEVGWGVISSNGTWQTKRGDDSRCARCPAGRASVLVEGDDEDAYTCELCGAGTFSPMPGSVACTPCSAGEAAPQPGSARCSFCSLGRFAPQTGQTACTSCPASFSTLTLGMSDPSACICDMGYYRDPVDRQACNPCKKGMTCPRASDALGFDPGFASQFPIVPLLEAGFWSSASDPLSVFRCEDTKRCPGGGRPGAACTRRLTSQACMTCEEGSRWTGDICEDCWDMGFAGLLFPCSIIIACATLVVVMYKVSAGDYLTWGRWRNGASNVISILVNYVQIIALVNSADISWPNRVEVTSGVFASLMDPLPAFRPVCALPLLARFRNMTILRTLQPAFLALMFFLVWGASRLIARKVPNVRMSTNRTLNCFYALIFTFFIGIAEMAFTVFKCRPNPNGTWSLIADRSVTCETDEWNSLVVIGVIAVLCWVVGFGVYFAYNIMRAPSKFHDRSFQTRWKFLFIRYRPDVYWWALAYVLKGIIVCVGRVIFKSGGEQVLFIAFCMILYVMLVSFYWPWRHLPNNAIDACVHVCVMMAASISLWFHHATGVDIDASAQFMSVALRVFVFIVLPPVPVLVIYLFIKENLARFAEAKMRDIELLLDGMELFCETPRETRKQFLENLIEWDLIYLRKASEVISMTTAGGEGRRTGYHHPSQVVVRKMSSTGHKMKNLFSMKSIKTIASTLRGRRGPLEFTDRVASEFTDRVASEGTDRVASQRLDDVVIPKCPGSYHVFMV